MNRIIINRNTRATIVFAAFELIYFVTHVCSMSAVLANLLVAISGFWGLFLCFTHPQKIRKNNIILLAIVFSVFFLISNLFTNNSNWTEVLWIWTYIGIALVLVNFNVSYKVVGIVYYIVVFFFVSCIIRRISPDVVITMGSRNNISTIMILYVILYLILRFLQTDSIDLIATVCCVVVCMWGMGRTGIICSTILLGALIFYTLFRKGYNKMWVILGSALILIVGYFIVTHYFVSTIEMAILRMNRMGLEDSARNAMYATYINDMRHGSNFIFGVPFNKNSLLSIYNNPHNSWLMLHAKYGIIPFIIVIYYIVKSIAYMIKGKKWFGLIIVIIAIVRSYFDWISFNGLFDVLWWFLIIQMIAYGGADNFFYEKK